MKFILADVGAGYPGFIILLFGVAICLFLFLALRAIVLWYWKIDKLVDNQQAQIGLLQEIVHAVNKSSNKADVMNE